MRARVPLLVTVCLLLSLALVPAAQGEPPKSDAPKAPTTEEQPTPAPEAEPDAEPEVNTDPRKAEAPLPAAGGWHASLVLDNDGVGVWTVKSYQLLDHLGCPEIVALDDKGHCHVLMSYSGKWTPIRMLHDGGWLGGLAHGDIDARVDGTEVYTGSRRGNVYQIRRYGHTLLDGRLIAHIDGREIHTIVAGELDPRSEGPEVLVFTRPGGLYRLTPDGEHGGFTTTKLMDLKGRVRDAVVLPAVPGRPASVATVSRTGRLELLTIGVGGPVWKTLHKAPMGMGRLALRAGASPERVVLYSTHDDGRILRHERGRDGRWAHETIYLGPQGPRGIAAGAFGERPGVETVAIFGYSKKVELLTRTDKGWTATTLFEDGDKGHWLSAAELDGRNATRELILCGFGGRVVLLARPPGFGREELAAER